MSHPEPDHRDGKICYLEIPAQDVMASAQFYARVFGWSVHERGDGTTGFDDTTGHVSGTWVQGGEPAAQDPGIVVSIMVANAAATLAAIIANGGTIVQPPDPAASEVYARFADPAGNVLGIYQQPGLEERLGGA